MGEATTPQLTAMLTGHHLQYLCEKVQEGRRGFTGAQHIDEWPFLFKKLKSLGYATFMSEDQGDLGEKREAKLTQCFFRGRIIGANITREDH